MKNKITLIVTFLLISHLGYCQKYIEGALIYKNGTDKKTLIHKKIKGSSIKIKDFQGISSEVQSKDLKRIIITSKKGDGEIWYEYLYVVDHKGKVGKKPLWLNKIIDGEMSLYIESFVFVGNPAGSGDSYYFKRTKEKEALLLSPLRLKKQLGEYFKDNPTLVKKIKSREIYDPREMVFVYNREL